MKKNELAVFNYEQNAVRIQKVNGMPWFVAKDVCDVLEYKDSDSALRKLDEDEKLIRKISGSAQEREMWTISESGLFALILRSNKQEAKKFRKWITGEVIPALMKTGSYSIAKRSGYYKNTPELELIQQYYTPVNKYLDGNRVLTTTEIMQELSTKTDIKLSEQRVGNALTVLGFEKTSRYLPERRFSVHGYSIADKQVKQLTPEKKSKLRNLPVCTHNQNRPNITFVFTVMAKCVDNDVEYKQFKQYNPKNYEPDLNDLLYSRKVLDNAIREYTNS